MAYTLYTYDSRNFNDPIIALGKKAKRIASYVLHDDAERVLNLLNNSSDLSTAIAEALVGANAAEFDRAFFVNEDTKACGLTYVQESPTKWIKYE